MVAFLSLVALTERRSIDAGNVRRCHDRPASVVRITTPAWPTSQHTELDGDEPSMSVAFTPVGSTCHVAPPSVECSTNPPTEPSRHRLWESADTIVVSFATKRRASV